MFSLGWTVPIFYDRKNIVCNKLNQKNNEFLKKLKTFFAIRHTIKKYVILKMETHYSIIIWRKIFMNRPFTLGEGVDSWNTIIFLYRSALKEVSTKVEILNDEFQQVHQYNPIEYIKSRIKSPESIVKKLKRYGYESSIDNMIDYVNDIAGIRIVCSFTSDIYKLAEMIGKQNDLTVVSVKDYMKHPKQSGYRSYHMLVTVPIFLSDRVIDTKVEIQIRTMAMDFWASLEHKIYYKFEGNAPQYISRDLRECSDMVSKLDEKMLQLNEAILEAKAAQEDGGVKR